MLLYHTFIVMPKTVREFVQKDQNTVIVTDEQNCRTYADLYTPYEQLGHIARL